MESVSTSPPGGTPDPVEQRASVYQPVRAPIQQLADSNVVGILFAKLDGAVVDANDEFLRMVGHSRDDLNAGKLSWTDMTPPEWKATSQQAVMRANATGTAPAFEKEYFRKDGTRVPVLVAVAMLPGPGADAVVLTVDLSERKSAEIERDQLLTEQIAMLDSVGDGIYGLDTSGRCTFINRAATRMLGYGTDECLGKNMHELVHFKHPDGSRYPLESCPIFGAVQTGTGIRVGDDTIWRRDGTPLQVEFSSCPIMMNSRIEGTVVSFKDISEREKAEARLRASEEQYRCIVENTHEGICTCDAERAITFCNHRMTAMLDYPDSTGDLTCSQIHFEEDREDILLRFERRKLGLIETYDTRLKRRDGSALWTSSSASPVYDAQRKFAGSLCMFRDITERKRLEEQLRQAQKMEAVGRLAGGIAHDFNNLLTVILGYGSVLERKLAPADPLLKNVVEIQRAGERAAALTQKLLAFSRKQVLRPRLLSLNHLIRDTDAMLKRLIGEDIELITTLDPSVGNIKADPGQIEQVILNLSINARDAMREGGHLLIETKRQQIDAASAQLRSLQPGNYALLTVTDTGSGMDEHTKARIFEPFFTTKEPGDGTGLGLATVLGIVNQSGGAISVYSEVGAGTSFKIYLPLVEGVAIEDVPPTSSPGLPAGERILVVEDDPAIRSLAGDVLREHGYQVLVAASGEEALRVSEKAPSLDLLVTDVIMNGMNGHELAELLVAARPGIKVLFMSGYPEKGIVQQGVLNPGVSFLPKPFRPGELLWQVGEVLTKNKGPAKILVVDDDVQVRSFLATVLEVEGYRVFQACNGKEAQALLREGVADLVITDLVMPEQEGLETIHAVRRLWPRLPIMAISGAFGGAYLDLAKKLGADAVLRKPFEPDVVLSEVRRLIAR